MKACETITASIPCICGCSSASLAERANSPTQAGADEARGSVFKELLKDRAAAPAAAEKAAVVAIEGGEDAQENKTDGKEETVLIGGGEAFLAGFFFTQADGEAGTAGKNSAVSNRVEALAGIRGGITAETAEEPMWDGMAQPAPVEYGSVEADIEGGDPLMEKQAPADAGLKQAGESPSPGAISGGYATTVKPEWGMTASGETDTVRAEQHISVSISETGDPAAESATAEGATAESATAESATAEGNALPLLKADGYEPEKAGAPQNGEAAAVPVAADAGFEASAVGATASGEDEPGVRTASDDHIEQIKVKADMAGPEAESGLTAPELRDSAERGRRRSEVPISDEERSFSVNGPLNIADKISKALKDSGGRPTDGENSSAGAAAGENKTKAVYASPNAAAFGTVAASTAKTTEHLDAEVKSDAAAKALDRLADDLISAEMKEGELRITLEPEKLGEISISVSKTESGISAKIRTEDRDLSAAISNHIHRLINTLESRGVAVGEVDVSYAPAGDGMARHSDSGWSAYEQGRSRAGVFFQRAGEDAFFKQWKEIAAATADLNGYIYSQAGSGMEHTVEYRI